MKMFWFIFFFLTVAIATQPCMEIITENGGSSHFVYNVAHAIHDMTLEVLQSFEPTAQADNGIPILNHDFMSEPLIFPNAPNTTTSSLRFAGSKIMDQVFQMTKFQENENVYFTIFKHLMHEMHMHEIWFTSEIVYKKEIKYQEITPDFCECVLDIEENGILEQLRYFGMGFRVIERYTEGVKGIRGNIVGGNKESVVDQPDKEYAAFIGVEGVKKAVEDNVGVNPIQIDFPMNMLAKVSGSMTIGINKPENRNLEGFAFFPHMTDASVWQIYKEILFANVDEIARDLALYLRCALAQ